MRQQLLKRALILGVAGQDGSYLAEYLLGLGYDVYGVVRRNSITENQQNRLTGFAERIHTLYGDVTDTSSLERAFIESKPDEVYNLAAMSHVKISFEIPQFTGQTNALGALNVLEAFRRYAPQARYYFAASSEMFGNSVDADKKQRETTPMLPVSPYGVAKLYGYHMTKCYRTSYKLFAACGILMNHESPRRGSNFVTNKIIKNAVLIKLGRIKELVLGNLDSSRDWGHSKDYVRAMHLIVNHDRPDDFVVATGETRTVRDLCQLAFSRLGMDYKDFVCQDSKYMRPTELDYLCGDSSKIRTMLGWKPEYTFEQMVDEMLSYWICTVK